MEGKFFSPEGRVFSTLDGAAKSYFQFKKKAFTSIVKFFRKHTQACLVQNT